MELAGVESQNVVDVHKSRQNCENEFPCAETTFGVVRQAGAVPAVYGQHRSTRTLCRSYRTRSKDDSFARLQSISGRARRAIVRRCLAESRQGTDGVLVSLYYYITRRSRKVRTWTKAINLTASFSKTEANKHKGAFDAAAQPASMSERSSNL